MNKQVLTHAPRVIAGSVQEVLNKELHEEPESLAYLIAFLGFVLNRSLRRDGQDPHA